MLDSGQSRYNNLTVYKYDNLNNLTVYKYDKVNNLYDNLNNLTACKTFTDKDLILRRSDDCIIKSPTTEKSEDSRLKFFLYSNSCTSVADRS